LTAIYAVDSDLARVKVAKPGLTAVAGFSSLPPPRVATHPGLDGVTRAAIGEE
jgi:hypothetical protein